MLLKGVIVLVTLFIVYQDLRDQAVDAWSLELLFLFNVLYFIFYSYNLLYLFNLVFLVLFLMINFLVLKFIIKHDMHFFKLIGMGDIVFLMSISFNISFIDLLIIIFIASLLGIIWSFSFKKKKIPFLVPLGLVYIINFLLVQI